MIKNMKDKINFIDINGKLDHKEIYSLFKTPSSKINKQISEKINIFDHNMEFFEFYSNEDIKNLLNIYNLKLSKNSDESFSLFKSDIEQYISCISHIILSIKLFFKTQDILTKIVINAKNHLSKLKSENKIENYNQDNLFLYLESILKNYEKNSKFFSSTSTLSSSNISSLKVTPKNSIFRKFSSEYKIDNFSNDEIEFNIQDRPPTPRFESDSKSDEKIENENKNSNLDDSVQSDSSIKKESVLTLSKYVFAEEPITPKNPESKLIQSAMNQSKIKRNSTKVRILHNEKINKHKKKRNASSETDVFNKFNDKNYYRNLLEMINKIYKKGLINSEEKVNLKQLVIEKSKKVEYLYYNIYKNSNNKNTLVTEVKKILNEL